MSFGSTVSVQAVTKVTRSIGVTFSARTNQPGDGSPDANLRTKFQKLLAIQPKVCISGVLSVIRRWSTTNPEIAVCGPNLDHRWADRPSQSGSGWGNDAAKIGWRYGRGTGKVPHDQSFSNVQSG